MHQAQCGAVQVSASYSFFVFICVRSLRFSVSHIFVFIRLRSLRVSVSYSVFTHDKSPLRSLSYTLRFTCGFGPKLSNNPTSYVVAFK